MNIKVILNISLIFCVFAAMGFFLKFCSGEPGTEYSGIQPDSGKSSENKVTLNNLPAEKIYGVTIETVHKNLSNTINTLSKFSKKTTARMVFDNDELPVQYLDAVRKVHNVSYVMGEIADSYRMNDLSVSKFKKRVKQYIDLIGDDVDIWEIGNEVNGEWNGDISDVINKLKFAYKYAKLKNKKTAVTFFYNDKCWENPDNEMFTWLANSYPHDMTSPDYVFVSYYEDNCDNPDRPDWQVVFDRLHKIFPDSKLGIGECGTTDKNKKEEYIRRYYTMNIQTPNYIGGYFWWYFKKDCVPESKPLWKVMNDAIGK
jgi:hypothetical protein